MKNTKNTFPIFKTLLTLSLLGLHSCSTSNYSASTNVTAVNISPSQDTWIADEPIVKNISTRYETVTLDYYKKVLHKKFPLLKTIREFGNISTLKLLVGKDKKSLAFYKAQTHYDYLISTEITLGKNDLPTFQLFPDKELSNELFIKITLYDLNTQEVRFERGYRFYDQFEGNNDIAFSPKLERFIDQSIATAIKDFGNKYNWSTVDTAKKK